MPTLTVSKPLLNSYRLHQSKWSACRACSLCDHRNKVVLFRGQLPCDVLFVGEAPGESENAIGDPFVGPAGDLLDRIIDDAQAETAPFSFGITNLVACIPATITDTSFGATRDPNKEEIIKCRNRLLEIISMAKPKLILTLGNIARVHLPRPLPNKVRENNLLHPAAILHRESSASANLDYKRMVKNIGVYTSFLQE